MTEMVLRSKMKRTGQTAAAETDLRADTDVKVSLISKIAYGMGDVGCNFSWMFVGNFLMIFYTDVFGISMGAVAGLMLAACLTVQGSRHGVFGGEALILPLMGLLLYVGYEAGRLSTLAQAEQRRRRRRAGPPYRGEQKTK